MNDTTEPNAAAYWRGLPSGPNATGVQSTAFAAKSSAVW
jgi:hypothetical protein